MYPELTLPLLALTGAALGYVVLVVARQPVQLGDDHAALGSLGCGGGNGEPRAPEGRLAEGVGFEPTVRFHVHTLSQRAP